VRVSEAALIDLRTHHKRRRRDDALETSRQTSDAIATHLRSTALALPARTATEAMAMLMNFIVIRIVREVLLISMEMNFMLATHANTTKLCFFSELRGGDACQARALLPRFSCLRYC
jgi:hypothetical protein